MKKVLSLILAMAIILSCFATSIVFNVGAATGTGDFVDVLGMSGYKWEIDSQGKYRVVKVTEAAPNGTTNGKTTSVEINYDRQEIGQPYTALYNIDAETADTTNSDIVAKCYGMYEVKSNSGIFRSDTASPEILTYQTALRATTENAVIVYIELPDYKANGEDWGFGIAKRGNGTKDTAEFDIGQPAWGAYLNRKADNTTGFSYLPAGEAEWISGTVYAEETSTRVMKTDLPSGFKGYVRFDLSKFDYMAFNEKTANSYMSAMTTLKELNFAYNGITETDKFVVGGLMYITTANDGRIFKFRDGTTVPLTEAISNQIHVLGMFGYINAMDSPSVASRYRVVKISESAPRGSTTGKTTSFSINSDREEAGQPYVSYYNLADGTVDPSNSSKTETVKCYGVYEVKSDSGTFRSDIASPEIVTYQTALRSTTDNAVIVYIELPDYKANGEDWGFGIARRGTEGTNEGYEFGIDKSYGFFFERKVNNTTGFSYLAEGEDEWVNGTVYAQETGSRVMKTDLPSGFKGYVRFDLSKFEYMVGDGRSFTDTAKQQITSVSELNFAYNGITETDILTVGGLMYITTPNDGKVLNFKNVGYAPIVSNTMQVRAQNLITDTANETNVTGTNIKLGYRNDDGTIRETDNVENRSFVAQMKLTKSGGLFLDDGYAGAIRPSSNQGSNVLLAGNTNYLNYLEDDNLNLKLKAGVNKFMFYVELPDVRALNNVTDDSMALALRPIIIDNQYTMKPYGLTYQFMDIREGVWHDGTISDGTEDPQKITYGTLKGLPTDGFKGYIKIDLDPIINNKTKDFIITKIQIGVSRAAWGSPVVIGGFYAIDVDNTDSTAYFMDPKTGEILTTKVLEGDFSGDEKYDATDLALAIKYLIKSEDITGAQTARASAFYDVKKDFNVVSLVQLKKILSGTLVYPPSVIENMEQYLPTDIELADNTIEFVGRYSKKDASTYQLAWSGSTIKTAFVGTQLAATFRTSSTEYGNDYLQIYIDGERVEAPLAIETISRKYTIARNLDFGYHYVEIVKRTDAPHTCITFEGFDYKDGAAAPPPANKARTIEFIGDSITAGWGNIASADSPAYINSETDATKSYGYLIAQNLNADAILLGMSGGGVALNNNGTTGRIPTYWASKAYTYDTTSVDFANTKAPDVVVINAGTNDTSGKATEAQYKTAYKALVEEVRSKYPNAFILCTIGSMTTAPYDWIEAVVNELIAEEAETANTIASYKIQVKTSSTGMKGGQGHPSAACHEIMAEEITAVLKEKLGW